MPDMISSLRMHGVAFALACLQKEGESFFGLCASMTAGTREKLDRHIATARLLACNRPAHEHLAQSIGFVRYFSQRRSLRACVVVREFLLSIRRALGSGWDPPKRRQARARSDHDDWCVVISGQTEVRVAMHVHRQHLAHLRHKPRSACRHCLS